MEKKDLEVTVLRRWLLYEDFAQTGPFTSLGGCWSYTSKDEEVEQEESETRGLEEVNGVS